MASAMDWIGKQSAKLSNPESMQKMFGAAVSYTTNPVTRIGVDAGLGAATALMAVPFDKQEDGVGSTIEKMIIGAGAGYASSELLTKGVMQGLRTQAGSDLAVDALDKFYGKHIPMLSENKDTIKKTVHAGAKHLIPSQAKGFKMMGAGAAAGLLYAMVNGKDDTMGETMLQSLTGAGLALMGSELYDHFKEKPDGANKLTWKDVKSGVKNAETTKNIKNVVDDVKHSDAGKALFGKVNDIFGDDPVFQEVAKGNLKNNLKPEQVHEFNQKLVDFRDFFTSDEGKQLLGQAKLEAGTSIQKNVPNLAKGIDEDMAKLFQKHGETVKKSLHALSSMYGENKDLVDDFLTNKHSKELASTVGDFMEKTVPNVVKKIDEANAGEVAGRTEPRANEASREQARAQAQVESENVSGRTASNGTVTSNDLNKEDLKIKQAAEKDKQAFHKKQQNWLGKAKLAGVIGAGLFATATIMDTSSNLGDDRRTSRMTEQQERNLERKMNKEEKERQKMGYGHIDLGQTAIDLFNERIGHHKMGNAKFQ